MQGFKEINKQLSSLRKESTFLNHGFIGFNFDLVLFNKYKGKKHYKNDRVKFLHYIFFSED